MPMLLAMGTPGRLLPLADRLVPGGVEQTLIAWAADGLSTDTMSDRLRDEHGIDVTRETVRKWLHHFEIRTAAMPTIEDGAA